MKPVKLMRPDPDKTRPVNNTELIVRTDPVNKIKSDPDELKQWYRWIRYGIGEYKLKRYRWIKYGIGE